MTSKAKHWKSIRNQPPVRFCGEIHMDGLYAFVVSFLYMVRIRIVYW